jgi:hypothetical protein
MHRCLRELPDGDDEHVGRYREPAGEGFEVVPVVRFNDAPFPLPMRAWPPLWRMIAMQLFSIGWNW